MNTVSSKRSSNRNTQVEIGVGKTLRDLFWGDRCPDLVHAAPLGREPRASQVAKGTSAEHWAEFCWLAAVASRSLGSLCTPSLNPFFTTEKKKKNQFASGLLQIYIFWLSFSESKSLLLQSFPSLGTLIGYFCL